MPKAVKYEIKVPPVLNDKLNVLVAESGKDTVEKYIISLIRAANKARGSEVFED